MCVHVSLPVSARAEACVCACEYVPFLNTCMQTRACTCNRTNPFERRCTHAPLHLCIWEDQKTDSNKCAYTCVQKISHNACAEMHACKYMRGCKWLRAFAPCTCLHVYVQTLACAGISARDLHARVGVCVCVCVCGYVVVRV